MGEDGEGREGWGGGEVEGHYGSCHSPCEPWAYALGSARAAASILIA